MNEKQLIERLEMIEECILDVALAINEGDINIYQTVGQKIFNTEGVIHKRE